MSDQESLPVSNGEVWTMFRILEDRIHSIGLSGGAER